MKISTSLLLAAIAVTAATAYDARNLRIPATIDENETGDEMNVAAPKTKKGIQKTEDVGSGGALDEDDLVIDLTDLVGKTNGGKTEINLSDLFESGKNPSSLDKLLDTISEDTSSSAKKDLSWLDDEETAEQTVIKGDSKPKKSSSTGEWEDSIARKPSTRKESDDMYEDYQTVKAVESETILEDDDEDNYAVKGKPKEITKDDDEDDIFTKGAGQRKSWDDDDDEDTHSSKPSTKVNLFPFDKTDDNDPLKYKTDDLYTSKDRTDDLYASKDKTDDNDPFKITTQPAFDPSKYKTDDLYASKDKTDDIFASKDKTDYSLGMKDKTGDIFASKDKTDDTFALKGKQPSNETDDDDDDDDDDDTDTLMENNAKKGKRDTYDDDDDDDEVIAVKEDKTTKFPKSRPSEEDEYESEDDVSQAEQTSFADEETASKKTVEDV